MSIVFYMNDFLRVTTFIILFEYESASLHKKIIIMLIIIIIVFKI